MKRLLIQKIVLRNPILTPIFPFLSLILLTVFLVPLQLSAQTEKMDKSAETLHESRKSVVEDSFLSPPVSLAELSRNSVRKSEEKSANKPDFSSSMSNSPLKEFKRPSNSLNSNGLLSRQSINDLPTLTQYSHATPNQKFSDEQTVLKQNDNPDESEVPDVLTDQSSEKVNESSSNFNYEQTTSQNGPNDFKFPHDYQPIQSFATNQISNDRAPTITRRVVYTQNTNLFVLSNGLTLFVRRDTNSQQATVRAYIRNTGSLNEEEYSGSGISHLVGEMVAACSTQKRSQAEIQNLLNQFGGATDVKITSNLTSFAIDCSSDLISSAIDILIDRILNARFDTSLFVSKSRIINQAFADAKSNRDKVAWNLLLETVYPNHPQRFPCFGYPDLFSLLTLNDVNEFYRQRYIPNNQIIVVAGNVHPDKIVQQIIQLYNNRPRIMEKDIVWPAESKQISRRDSVQEMDGKTFDAIFAWPTVYLTDNDVCALDVLAKILAQNENGRLLKTLKQEKSLIISANSQSYLMENVRGFFYIKVAALPENYEMVQQIILNEIKKLQDYPVAIEELNRAKKQIETAFIFQKESLSISIDRMIANYLQTGDPNYENQYLNNLRNVSLDDIRRVAQLYFQTNFMTRVLITPIQMAPQAVSFEKTIPDEELQAIKFPENDLRLLTKTNRRVPIINIQLIALGSSLIESQDKAGKTALLAEMLKMGKVKQTGQSYLDYFDSLGASFKIQTGRNTVCISATVLKDDLPFVIPVIKEMAFQLDISDESLQKAKKIQFTKIEQNNNSPENELMNHFSNSLPRSTPFHLPLDGTKESIERLTCDDMVQCQRQLFAPQNIVLTVFGDIDYNQAANWINNEFGSVKKTINFRPVSFDRKNELIESLDLHFQTQKETAMAILAFPTVSIQEVDDYAALLVLQTILAGYRFPDGILVNELRNEGLVDRIQVKQMSSPVPSYFYVMFETKPEQLASVLNRVQKSIEKTKTGFITSEQIQKAKEKLKACHKLENPLLEEKARKTGLDELYGVGFNNDLRFDEQIDKVTQEKVLSVARKYFNQKIVITISPFAIR
ncbi:MAG: pitrilysin family protein [Planctomycetia bacterium]|nr:pitrilysin family protein [Planctomycetia bacterium]